MADATLGGLQNKTARAEFACISCKRRKVKCDRILPLCLMCRKTDQECEYPLEAAKPGPKIGSTRRNRTRSRGCEERVLRPATHRRPGGSVRGASIGNGLDTVIISNPSVCFDDAAKRPNNIEAQPYPLSPAEMPLDVRTLAYIVHPSHDVADISGSGEGSSREPYFAGQAGTAFGPSGIIDHACSVLGIAPHSLERLISLYFEYMTSLSLFHRPTFEAKLRNIASETQVIALLALMASFLSRVMADSEVESSNHSGDRGGEPLCLPHPPQYYEDLSEQYTDQAMKECSSEIPPLCLLQCLILVTFQQLIKGVRGSAWRRLGVCIRVAYELNLHHVDIDNVPEEQDVAFWCDIEEKRRAWWAIWEMDTFTSTIKRCPSGIDWTDNETRLPVSDDHWFNKEFHPSCFLEAKPMDRLKSLQRCGNEATGAWLIVMNSYMREAHLLSKFKSPRPWTGRHGPSRVTLKDAAKETTESLGALGNALRCFSMALPKRLRYRDDFLSFSSRDPSQAVAVRRQHSDIYSIHVVTQLARIMVNHQDAFRGAQQDLKLVGANKVGKDDFGLAGDSECLCLRLGSTRKGLKEYIDAADALLHIVSQSAEEHVRYVNPFLASIIWYGAAVHRAWQVLAPPRMNTDYIASKFEVMRMTFDNFASVWDLPQALRENLHTIADKLNVFVMPKERRSSSGSHGIDGTGNQAGNIENDLAPSPSYVALDVQSATTVAVEVGDHPAAASRTAETQRPSFMGPSRGESDAGLAAWYGNTHTSIKEPEHAILSPRSMWEGGSNKASTLDTPSQVGENWSGQDTAPFDYGNTQSLEGLWDDVVLDSDFSMDPDGLFLALASSN